VGGDSDQPAFVVVGPDGVQDPDHTGHPQVDAAVWAVRFANAWARADTAMALAIYNAGLSNAQEHGADWGDYLCALFELALTAQREAALAEHGTPARVMPLKDIIRLWADPPATS
jgi:hypothetical protein